MTLWIPGLPKEDGIYWYDSGFDHVKEPAVLQVRGESIYMFGDFGSMPISSVYHPKMEKQVSYALVAEHYEWQDYKCVTSRCRAWVKTPEGMIGFGLLSQGGHNNVHGTWLWPRPHINASECGRYVRDTDNFVFSIVDKPKVKARK